METETYVIHAKTERSAMSVATQDPDDALKRAREMMRAEHAITITDRNGNIYSIEEMEANVASGVYAKPASSGR